MTKTEIKKRNSAARVMYLKCCKAMRKEPMDGWQKAGECSLKLDIQGKYMTVKRRRLKVRALIALGLTRKAARQTVR